MVGGLAFGKIRCGGTDIWDEEIGLQPNVVVFLLNEIYLNHSYKIKVFPKIQIIVFKDFKLPIVIKSTAQVNLAFLIPNKQAVSSKSG